MTMAPQSDASAMSGLLGVPSSPEVPSPGVKRRSGRGHIDSYGEGRVCSAHRCGTQLSRYNATSVCANHEAEQLRVGPGSLRVLA